MANSSFNNILDIQGLLPVDLHSSNPYPVPFSQPIRPTVPQAAPAPVAGVASNMLPGSASPPAYNPMNGGGGTFGDSSPGFAGASDPFFALSGMGGGGSYSGFSGGAGGGYDPSWFGGYGSDINPAQLTNGLGSLNWGAFGDGLSNRFDSLTASPYFDSDNAIQAGVNGLGLLSPFAGIGAGIAQGLGLWNGGLPTGNSLADIAATPGGIQNGSSYLTNQLWQLFGGTPLTGDPNMSGPGGFNGGPGGYIPAQVMGPNPDGSAYGSVPTPTARPDDGGTGEIYGGGDFIGTSGGGAGGGFPSLSDYYGPGGQAFDIGGASIFNSIGLSPLMTGDMGGAWGGGTSGGGTGGGWGTGSLSADDNGGWGQ